MPTLSGPEYLNGQFSVAADGTVSLTTPPLSAATGGTIGGPVVIKTNTAVTLPTAPSDTLLQLSPADGVGGRFMIDGFGAGIASITARRAKGTAAAPLALATDDALLSLGGFGYGATGYSAGARSYINFYAAQAWTDTVQGSYIGIGITPLGGVATKEAVRIDPAGNVGIGTTAPGFPLDVAGLIGSTAAFPGTYWTETDQGVDSKVWRLGSAGGLLSLQTLDDAKTVASFALSFARTGNAVTSATVYTSNTARLFIDSSGNVGIGTAAPLSKLDVNGGAAIGTYAGTIAAPANVLLVSGNIGIGTTAPTSRLTVSANAATLPAPPASALLQISAADGTATRAVVDSFAAAGNFFFRRANGTAAAPSALALNDNIGSVVAIGYGASAYGSSSTASIGFFAAEAWTGTAQGSLINFTTTPVGAVTASERMRIDRTGNVGIGTTTPTARLSVSSNTGTLPAPPAGTLLQIGAANSTPTTALLDSFAQTSTLSLRRANGTAASPSALANGDPIGLITGFGYGSSAYGGSNAVRIGFYAAEAWTDTAQGTVMTFVTTLTGTVTPVERMRIDPAGNVGIGTFPAYKLDVLGADGEVIRLRGGSGVATQSAYFNAQGRATFGYDGSRQAVVLNDLTDALVSASKPICFDTSTLEAMRITTSQELLLGTTAPGQGRFVIGGTYTTVGAQVALIFPTFISSVTTTQYGMTVQPFFQPSGASLTQITGIRSLPQISASATVNIGTLSAFNALGQTIAGYTGTIGAYIGYDSNTPTLLAGNPIATVIGFRQNPITNGSGITSGSVANEGVRVSAFTAAAGAGGTITNTGVRIFMPTSSSAGNTDRGLWITGTGGALSTKYSLYNDSAEQSYFAAGVVLGAATGGNKGAGTLNATAVYANGVALTSDANLKRDIAPLPACLPLVAAIEPKSFRWTPPEEVPIDDDGNPIQIAPPGFYEQLNRGFIAQEVAKALGGPDDTVDLGGLVAVLWQAMREVETRLETLETLETKGTA